MKWFLFIASINVDGTGAKQAACKNFASVDFICCFLMISFIYSCFMVGVCECLNELFVGSNTSQDWSVQLRLPVRTMLLFLVMCIFSFLNVTSQLSSHNWGMERSDALFKPGTIDAVFAFTHKLSVNGKSPFLFVVS